MIKFILVRVFWIFVGMTIMALLQIAGKDDKQ